MEKFVQLCDATPSVKQQLRAVDKQFLNPKFQLAILGEVGQRSLQLGLAATFF